jgi:hypothetical protein
MPSQKIQEGIQYYEQTLTQLYLQLQRAKNQYFRITAHCKGSFHSATHQLFIANKRGKNCGE